MKIKSQKSLSICNPIVPLRFPCDQGGAKNARLALIRTVIYAYYYQWVPDDGLVDGYLFLNRRNDKAFSKYQVAAILGRDYETLCLHTYG